MSATDLDINDYLIRAMHKDLDRIISQEVGTEASYPIETRKAMNMVLAESVRTQRLYFVVRSVLMSLISASIYFIVVLYLGAIDAFQAAFLGVFVFLAALVVSRVFDRQIVKASKRIIHFLIKHEKLRRFVLRRL
jgi:ABC-type transport system involved in cytochrome bd biosynthesis fused ATPase/permease subunit